MLTNNDLKQIKNLIDPLSTDIKDVKKRVRKIEGTIDVMINQFDREIVDTQKRVKRIENHISLPTRF